MLKLSADQRGALEGWHIACSSLGLNPTQTTELLYKCAQFGGLPGWVLPALGGLAGGGIVGGVGGYQMGKSKGEGDVLSWMNKTYPLYEEIPESDRDYDQSLLTREEQEELAIQQWGLDQYAREQGYGSLARGPNSVNMGWDPDTNPAYQALLQRMDAEDDLAGPSISGYAGGTPKPPPVKKPPKAKPVAKPKKPKKAK